MQYEVELVETDGDGVTRVEVYDKAKGAKGLYNHGRDHYWFAMYERRDDGLAEWHLDYANIEIMRDYLRELKTDGHEVTWMPSTRPWLEQFGEGWKEL